MLSRRSLTQHPKYKPGEFYFLDIGISQDLFLIRHGDVAVTLIPAYYNTTMITIRRILKVFPDPTVYILNQINSDRTSSDQKNPTTLVSPSTSCTLRHHLYTSNPDSGMGKITQCIDEMYKKPILTRRPSKITVENAMERLKMNGVLDRYKTIAKSYGGLSNEDAEENLQAAILEVTLNRDETKPTDYTIRSFLFSTGFFHHIEKYIHVNNNDVNVNVNANVNTDVNTTTTTTTPTPIANDNDITIQEYIELCQVYDLLVREVEIAISFEEALLFAHIIHTKVREFSTKSPLQMITDPKKKMEEFLNSEYERPVFQIIAALYGYATEHFRKVYAILNVPDVLTEDDLYYLQYGYTAVVEKISSQGRRGEIESKNESKEEDLETLKTISSPIQNINRLFTEIYGPVRSVVEKNVEDAC